MKYLLVFSFLLILSNNAFAQKLDVGVNIPADFGETFKQEKINYEQFKGNPFYLLVWDSANELLLRDIIRWTKDSPAPVVVMCLGQVKVGSRKKDYTECELQVSLLSNERVTLIKKKRNTIAKAVKLPTTDHLFVIDEKGTVVQKVRLLGR